MEIELDADNCSFEPGATIKGSVVITNFGERFRASALNLTLLGYEVVSIRDDHNVHIFDF